MIKQIWIAQCDVCGKKENARIVCGRYNEDEYALPEGWQCGHNTKVHMCGDCARKLARKEGEA